MRSAVVLTFLTTMMPARLARAFILLPSRTRSSPTLRQSSHLIPFFLGTAKASSTATTIEREGNTNTFSYNANMDCWRPTVNDVERISWGKPAAARRKGTGSRGVPHRLNQQERVLFDQARAKGFLQVAGSGWRSQRRDAPLLNSYRSLCDARGKVVIMLQKQQQMASSNSSSLLLDRLVVDLSPLRLPGTYDEIAAACLKQHEGGVIVSATGGSSSNTIENDEEDEQSSDEGAVQSNKSVNDASVLSTKPPNPWETRPIYQIDPHYIVWELPRADAKALGKKLAAMFDTAEGCKRRAPSKKPIGIKPGKSRRHGGYGIG